MESDKMDHADPHDIETGIADALQRHITRHVVPPPKIPQWRLDLEGKRPKWISELFAEALGVFMFVYAGISSVAGFVLNGADPAVSSVYQIGWGFGLGVAFAIIVCAPVSGGHFNPAISICFALWKGFPWKKVPQYILAQISGSFIAGMMVLGQYKEQINALQAKLRSEGVTSFNFNGGPGSLLCSFPNEDQMNLGYLFMTEFFASAFIALVIWGTLDAANPFVNPVAAPWIIGLAFAAMIWGFADITVSLNMARDLGTRIVAAIFFGGDAFTYHSYSWISLLVTIPASVCATWFYEFVFKDNVIQIAQGHAAHVEGDEGFARHFSKLDDSRSYR